MAGFATLSHVGSSALIPLPGSADHLGHQNNIKNKTKKAASIRGLQGSSGVRNEPLIPTEVHFGYQQ